MLMNSNVAPVAGAEIADGDALFAMLLYARDDAIKLNRPLTAHFLEMACLDLAQMSATAWMEGEGEAIVPRRRATLRPE